MMRTILTTIFMIAGGAGCTSDSHFAGGTPILPVGGTEIPPAGDAGTRDLDAGGSLITGTVCVQTSVAAQACAPLTGEEGLLVTLHETGTKTSIADDGTFSMPGTPGLTQVTLISSTTDTQWFGGATVVALTAAGGGHADIPVLSQTDAQLLGSTNVGALTPGAGILFVRTSPGVTVANGSSSVFYDVGSTPVLSTTPPTGASGTAVIFGGLGAQTVTLTRDGQSVMANGVLFPNAVTYLAAPF